jgi:hypothetical protein
VLPHRRAFMRADARECNIHPHRHIGRAANQPGSPRGHEHFCTDHTGLPTNLNVITMTARGSGLNPVRQMGLLVALRRMKQMCLRQLA